MAAPMHRQRGLTFWGWLTVVVLVAFFGIVAMRLTPLYLEYFRVAASMESLKSEPDVTRKPRGEIRRLLARRFDINDVRSVRARDVRIQGGPGLVRLSVEYEARTHLIGNLDVVARFRREVRLVGG